MCFIQPYLKNLKGWRLYISQQSMPWLNNPHGKISCLNLSCFNLCPLSLCSMKHWFNFLITCHRHWGLLLGPSKLSLLQTDQAQFSEPLFTRQVLQPPLSQWLLLNTLRFTSLSCAEGPKTGHCIKLWFKYWVKSSLPQEIHRPRD